jgi:hypothetical protein
VVRAPGVPLDAAARPLTVDADPGSAAGPPDDLAGGARVSVRRAELASVTPTA